MAGRVDGLRLTLEIRTASGTRTEQRELKEPPALMLNLGRRLARDGLTAGARHTLMVFDPATLSNAPVTWPSATGSGRGRRPARARLQGGADVLGSRHHFVDHRHR